MSVHSYLEGDLERTIDGGLWLRPSGPVGFQTVADDRSSRVPRSSVLVSNYNEAAWVPDLVRSVNELDDDLEVIVVDDASADGSAASIATGLSRSSLVVSLDRNSGSHALPLNLAIRLAQGEHVVFIDADDYIVGSAATRASRELLERDTAARGTISNTIVRLEPGAHLPWRADLERLADGLYLRKARTYAFDDLTDYARAVGLRGFRRADLYAAGGWVEGLRGQADYGMLLKMVASGPLVPEHGSFYVYRIHGMNMSFDPTRNVSSEEKRSWFRTEFPDRDLSDRPLVPTNASGPRAERDRGDRDDPREREK